MKRAFIAVNLSQKTKKDIEKRKEILEKAFNEKTVRWVRDENLHITLFFLGGMGEERKGKIISEIEKMEKRGSFEVLLKNISYFPSNKREAKMIFLNIEGEDIKKLYQDIKKRLVSSNIISNKRDEKEFIPHITLGRINLWNFRRYDLFEIPDIEEDVNLKFNVSSLDLMESKLKRGGAEYRVIKNFKLSH